MRVEKRTLNAKNHPEALIACLAKRQYGVFTGQQALEAGLNQCQLKRRVNSGRYERVHRGVFRVAGSPASPHHKLMIAVLAAGPGAVVSYAAALWLFGLPGGDPAPQISLLLPARSRNLAGVKVHATTYLPERDRTVRFGIAVTTPARLVADMAGVLPRKQLEILLDAVRSKSMASDAAIAWYISELAGPGRKGLNTLAELLAARSKEGGVPASVLESLGRLVLAGLPPHRFNRAVVADKERVLDIDFLGTPLTIEFDGWEHHSGRVRHQADIDRQNALATQGRTVLRFTYQDVTENPQRVRDIVIANGLRLAGERGDIEAQAAWAAADPKVPQWENRCHPA